MYIRRAVPADGPAYLALVHSLAEFEKLPPPDEAACKRLLADAFADPPRYQLWVAEITPGTIAAYAATFLTYSTFLAKPTLFVEDIFVHRDARRRGVATAMLNHFKDIASELGCGRLELLVLDWNRDAQVLYERLGAEMKSEWRLMRVLL